MQIFYRSILILQCCAFFALLSCSPPLHEGGDSSSSINYNTELDQQALQITAANCTACHGANSPGYGGIKSIDNISNMILTGIVVPGQPENSSFLQSIKDLSMPPSSPLSLDDQELLETWILSLSNR